MGTLEAPTICARTLACDGRPVRDLLQAAFMILLSLWGPVLASVSCLMTTILVEIADVLLGHRLKWLSVSGVP